MPKNNWDARYICVGPFAWGRSDSIEKAKRTCVANIGVKVTGPKVQHCVVYEVFSDEVEISGMDGSLSWTHGDTPPRIVWMGSEFSRLNPGRAVGQNLGLVHPDGNTNANEVASQAENLARHDTKR